MENLPGAPMGVPAQWQALSTTEQIVVATEMCLDVWLKNSFYIIEIRHDDFFKCVWDFTASQDLVTELGRIAM